MRVRLEVATILRSSMVVRESQLRLEANVLNLASDGPWLTLRAFIFVNKCGCVAVWSEGLLGRWMRDYVLEMDEELVVL